MVTKKEKELQKEIKLLRIDNDEWEDYCDALFEEYNELESKIEELEEDISLRTALNAQLEMDKIELREEFEEETKKIMDEHNEFMEQVKPVLDKYNKIDLGYIVKKPDTFNELWKSCSINDAVDWDFTNKLRLLTYSKKRTWLHNHRYIKIKRYMDSDLKLTEDNFELYKDNFVILRRVK